MTFVVITLASFFASLLTLFSGFGLGTLLMPVAAIFFPVAVAVALTAFVHLLSNLFKLAAFRRSVEWRVALKFGIPALVAAIPGAWLLALLSGFPTLVEYTVAGIHAAVEPVKLVAGLLLVIFASAESSGMAKKVEVSQRFLPLGGVLSGFFGGLSGHQGAFRSAFLLRAGLNTEQFVATNALIASMVDAARLLVYGLNISMLENVDVSLVVSATLAAFAGVMAGKAGIHKVTMDSVRRLVAAMLYLLGAGLIAGII